MSTRYKFVRDDDCHWYLIPEELDSKFYWSLKEGSDDCYAEFCSTFDEYRIDSPCDYSFEKPVK